MNERPRNNNDLSIEKVKRMLAVMLAGIVALTAGGCAGDKTDTAKLPKDVPPTKSTAGPEGTTDGAIKEDHSYKGIEASAERNETLFGPERITTDRADLVVSFDFDDKGGELQLVTDPAIDINWAKSGIPFGKPNDNSGPIRIVPSEIEKLQEKAGYISIGPYTDAPIRDRYDDEEDESPSWKIMYKNEELDPKDIGITNENVIRILKTTSRAEHDNGEEIDHMWYVVLLLSNPSYVDEPYNQYGCTVEFCAPLQGESMVVDDFVKLVNSIELPFKPKMDGPPDNMESEEYPLGEVTDWHMRFPDRYGNYLKYEIFEIVEDEDGRRLFYTNTNYVEIWFINDEGLWERKFVGC
jgi:hypothetical protein